MSDTTTTTQTLTLEERYRLHVALLERDLATERARLANTTANQAAQAFDAIRAEVFKAHGLGDQDKIDLSTGAITRAAPAAQE